MKDRQRVYLLMPILIAIFLSMGVFIGKQLSEQSTSAVIFPNHATFQEKDKLQQVISYIKSDYVDTIVESEIIEATINKMLQDLDPHSYYIPKQDYHAVNDPLEGNFEGIGIEFRIKDDTVMVVRTIGGGPSEKIGIMAGDRIVSVEKEDITGKEIDNDKVVKLLKGPKGSVVNIRVKRAADSPLLDFSIQRDEIPLYSVESSYLIDDKVGYVKVIRFARDTYNEFVEAVEQLKSFGMEKLIVDLRNNGGGFLQSATKMADEFLEEGELIVYTEGKSRKRENFYASKRGMLKNTETAILINENSASASEILAGALQDNDKGHIVGRRSFGKGLVQEGVQWPDGSAMRLTVARYYTPTGRSIQKPYKNGAKAYYSESYERYESGEMLSTDSIDFPDSLKYTTKGGKVLYGGGGIMPDYFVPLDTSNIHAYYGKLNYRGMFYLYGFQFADENRSMLNEKYTENSFVDSFELTDSQLKQFYIFADKNGVELDETAAEKNKELIKNRLKATIGRTLFGDNVFNQILNKDDETVKKAIEVLYK